MSNTIYTAESVSLVQSCAVAAVLDERARQDAKWGTQNHTPIVWSAILTEECGEFAKEALEFHFSVKPPQPNLRYEAVQVAAVALAIIECIDRHAEANAGENSPL
jgi:hypothetical protein